MQIDELYVLGVFVDGKFKEYVRKGRNNSISGYDNLGTAKRGRSHSLKSGRDIRIMIAGTMHFVDDNGERVIR